MKKRKNNKKKLIIITIIILILWLIFKSIMLVLCSIDINNYTDITKGLKNRDEITITNKSLADDEYFIIGNLKMKNIMDGYKIDDINSPQKYIKEINGKKSIINFISDVEKNTTIVNSFKSKTKNIGIYGEKNKVLDIYYLADRKGFLLENNIENDIDFYKFVGDNYPIKNTLFTSIKKMMQNYAFNYCVNIAVPKIESMTIIKGDLEGYIFEVGSNNNIKTYQITILDNDKQYGFSTNDSRFKDKDFMIDVISTINID